MARLAERRRMSTVETPAAVPATANPAAVIATHRCRHHGDSWRARARSWLAVRAAWAAASRAAVMSGATLVAHTCLGSYGDASEPDRSRCVAVPFLATWPPP
jgi:hypothetical protein